MLLTHVFRQMERQLSTTVSWWCTKFRKKIPCYFHTAINKTVIVQLLTGQYLWLMLA